MKAHKTIRTIRDFLNEGRFVSACEVFNDIEDDEVLAVVQKRWPSLSDYDRRGNFVGQVANENGWTA